METQTEKRQRRRESIDRSITYEMSDCSTGRFENLRKEGFGVDISNGGIGLITDQPLKKGNVLKLLYPLTVASASIPIYSEVMWSNPVEGGFRVGLRFLS
jgi:hypothetical protein